MNNHSTLIYCGANKGYSLTGFVYKYKQIFAFEPDPEMFATLKVAMSLYPWVQCFNVACSSDYGTAALHISPNRVATSLGQSAEIYCPPNTPYGGTTGRKHPDDTAIQTVLVPTINLGDFLQKKNINLIDHYVSDCQGSDLNILKTMKPFIDDNRIYRLQLETYTDNTVLYKGLDNSFSKFKALLNRNYRIEKIEMDRTGKTTTNEADIPPEELEWDTTWVVKNHHYFYS